MAEHSLPDNLNEWPSDPYRLLGVDYGCTLRALRRAYSRLIRRFKPDAFPEHFERIHAAYEIVRFYVEVNERSEEPQPGGYQADDRPEDESSDGPGEPDEPYTPFAAGPLPSVFDPQREIQAAWRLAVAGDPEQAYAKLVSLHEREQASEAAGVCLYWLLVGMPQLDAERSPCDWLVEALRHARLTGPAMSLYARELRANAEEALELRCTGLVGCRSTAPDRFRFLAARWRALSSLRRPNPILWDLERIDGEFAEEDVDMRSQYLVLALEQLAWFQENEAVHAAFDRLRRELEALGQLSTSVHNQLAQIDVLVHVSRSWQAISRNQLVAEHWRELVPLGWTQDTDVVYRRMLSMFERIALDPRRAFRELENVNACSPTVLHYLGSLILQQPDPGEQEMSPRDDREVERLLVRFLVLRRRELEERLFRCRSDPDRRTLANELLLDFCLQEVIHPAELEQRGTMVGAVLNRILPLYSVAPVKLPATFRNDGSLGYVYEGCRRFWART